MTIEDIKQNGMLIFECISGSKAYGLDIPGSDTDLKGVFILPGKQFFGLSYTPQVSNASNDEVYYELKRFVELCFKNNPNVLEMLDMPEALIQFQHPLFKSLKPEFFLSKLCKDSFAGYATSQIKKARGLNKKILNPIPKEKKTILDFCYILQGQGALPLRQWLIDQNLDQKALGLVNIPHMKGMYGVYQDSEQLFKGIMRIPDSDEVALSSIPKGLSPIAHMHFNKDGYSKYCKDYRDYWSWVDKRNDVRYKSTLEHGKNYDAKNMMHTFRLLDMAEEILSEGKILVKRPNREELLEIRSGKFTYDDLLDKAAKKIKRIEKIFQSCSLPEKPDANLIENLLVNIRQEWGR